MKQTNHIITINLLTYLQRKNTISFTTQNIELIDVSGMMKF